MKETAIVLAILDRLESLIDEVQDEQSFLSVKNDSEAYVTNAKQESLLKNAHIMVSNAFDKESKFL